MDRPLRLLVADDDDTFRKVLAKELGSMGFEVGSVASGEEAVAVVGKEEFDVVLLDIRMPGMDGMVALQMIKETRPFIEVIMLTGHGTIDSAIESVKLGAYHYLTKPCKLAELELVINKAVEKKKLERQNVLLRQELARRDQFDEFIGGSQKLRRVYELISRIAVTESTVLIQGDSGAGKELAARAIHRHSARRENPFVVVDCTSLQEELLQSELFGHEKGAFTGAVSLKHGLFEVADKGTVFLDEIAELSLGLQSKLLRVLETGTFRRVGSVSDIHVDTRIIAATNKDLKKLTAEGTFREDLYYRLNVVTIVIPPLRERTEDIPDLVKHFVTQSVVPGRQKKRISKEALALLAEYNWPGNVRELKNVIERALILSEGDQIGVEDLPGNLRMKLPFLSETNENEYPSLEKVETLYIAKLLNEHGGNRAKVAKILGISERNLYRKIKEYGL